MLHKNKIAIKLPKSLLFDDNIEDFDVSHLNTNIDINNIKI